MVAFEVEGDTNHSRAAASMQDIASSIHGEPAISDYVFDETVTVTLVRTGDLRKARLVGESMFESFRILRVDESIFQRAWRRFRNQKGTTFSFTDSTTIELMQEHGIKQLATFDREFSSRGFTIVGRS